MTNREKYYFDDYTLDKYKRLVQMASDKGFKFILHKDEFVPVCDEKERHLQVLTHDGNRGDEVLSVRKRYYKMLHAQSVQ